MLTPVTPSNTPQSPVSGRESPTDMQSTINRIQSLRLDADHVQNSQNEGQSLNFNCRYTNRRNT